MIIDRMVNSDLSEYAFRGSLSMHERQIKNWIFERARKTLNRRKYFYFLKFNSEEELVRHQVVKRGRSILRSLSEAKRFLQII